MSVYTRLLPLTITTVKNGLEFLMIWIRTDKSSVCLNLNNISTYNLQITFITKLLFYQRFRSSLSVKQIHFNPILLNVIQPTFYRRPDRSQRTREARYSSADNRGKEALLPPRDRDERISPLLQDLSAEQKNTMTVFYNQYYYKI